MRRSSDATNADLLKGWRQIAAYLKCSIRHAQRRKDKEGLPLISPENSHGLKGRIFASKRALDFWLKGAIEIVALTEDELIAFGRKSNPLWTYRFPDQLCAYTREELAWRLQLIGLPGKQEQGVLAAIQFRSGGEREKLRHFDNEGNLVWAVDVDPHLQMADRRSFEDAWTIKQVMVVPGASGPSIWAALANSAGWGGCILRFATDGTSTVQFANAGHVERLGVTTVYGEKCLVFCGENNDFDCAFVALHGLNDPPSYSVPGKRRVYRFADATTERPRKVILFPQSELILARNKPYGHATNLCELNDRIIVHVETGGEGAEFLYHFAPDLEPLYVFPSGSHELAHQALERMGRINHSWRVCAEKKNPLTLRVWTAISGWTTRSISWRDDPWQDD